MADKVADERIGVGPLELRAVLPVVFCQEDEGGTQKILDVWRRDVPATDAPEGGATCLELQGEEVGSEGTAAEPAAGCIYVEHAAEYFCVEVGRGAGGEGVVHILASAEQGDEVGGRTERLQEGELEGDAF